MYDYYISSNQARGRERATSAPADRLPVAKIKGRYNGALSEQGLLSWAYRPLGNMPALVLDLRWNMIRVNQEAMAGRVASIHDKWWEMRTASTPIRSAGTREDQRGDRNTRAC